MMEKTNSNSKLHTAVTLIFLFSFTAIETLAATGYASQNGGTTGGAGGQIVKVSTGTEIHQAICNRIHKDTPLIIHVEGTITPENTSSASGSCNTIDGDIELKDISNISIIGVGKGALFDEIGIHIRASSNIILQNLYVRDVKKSNGVVSNGGDAIGMDAKVSNVWVDHCTLEAYGSDGEVYDSLFDLKNNVHYVTLSYSLLKNSGRGGLVGSSEGDDSNNYITYHHNYFFNIDSRTPLVRHATVHVYNNYFNGISDTGINSRAGGRIKIENNFIENAVDPLGTFYTDIAGYWQLQGNIWGANVSWSTKRFKHHPAGPNPTSTTNINIPYTSSLDDAICVPNIVLKMAGANTGLQTSDGSCSGGPYTSSNSLNLPNTLSPSSSSSWSSGGPSNSSEADVKFTIEENQKAFCGVDGVVDNKDGGYSGSGFADTGNASGNGVNYAVNVRGGGRYKLSFMYANGSQARPAELIINNAIVANLPFDGTGSWSNWADTKAVSVYLGAGNNLLRLEATQGKGLANIDYISLLGEGIEAGDCSIPFRHVDQKP